MWPRRATRQESEANDERCYHLGKQVPAETTFATKAEARAWLATMGTDILGGRHVNPTSGRELFGIYAVDDGLLRVNPVHIKGAAVERSIERPEPDWDDVQHIAAAIHPEFRVLV